VLALLLTAYGHRPLVPGWIHTVAILISLALSLGYLTPIAAVTALAFHVLSWFSAGADSAAVALIYALDALALALLGPGAYSVDAYLFGRRLVVLPPQ
jgi:uncharacterized membrane protein YphA (DoxX/SURF4 family)